MFGLDLLGEAMREKYKVNDPTSGFKHNTTLCVYCITKPVRTNRSEMSEALVCLVHPYSSVYAKLKQCIQTIYLRCFRFCLCFVFRNLFLFKNFMKYD